MSKSKDKKRKMQDNAPQEVIEDIHEAKLNEPAGLGKKGGKNKTGKKEFKF